MRFALIRNRIIWTYLTPEWIYKTAHHVYEEPLINTSPELTQIIYNLKHSQNISIIFFSIRLKTCLWLENRGVKSKAELTACRPGQKRITFTMARSHIDQFLDIQHQVPEIIVKSSHSSGTCQVKDMLCITKTFTTHGIKITGCTQYCILTRHNPDNNAFFLTANR